MVHQTLRRRVCVATLQAVTLHTSHGDLKLELFCEEVPKACHNFLALCASNFYDGTIFHRNIRGFMLQGGDPTGTGRGGRSIFDTPSGKFEDEIAPGLSHDKAGVVSMANSGPNTNGASISKLNVVGALHRSWSPEAGGTAHTPCPHLRDAGVCLHAVPQLCASCTHGRALWVHMQRTVRLVTEHI